MNKTPVNVAFIIYLFSLFSILIYQPSSGVFVMRAIYMNQKASKIFSVLFIQWGNSILFSLIAQQILCVPNKIEFMFIYLFVAFFFLFEFGIMY